MKNKVKDLALDGVLRQNPTFKLVLGTCPTLALTTAAASCLGMGLAVTFVLICSNIIISLLRNVIPDKVRIPCFIVIIATFVTVVRIVMEAYMPDLYESLGVYLPLIVVNCIILARAESFASKQPVLPSAVDGLAMGIGYTFALVMVAAVRELVGAGMTPKYSVSAAQSFYNKAKEQLDDAAVQTDELVKAAQAQAKSIAEDANAKATELVEQAEKEAQKAKAE